MIVMAVGLAASVAVSQTMSSTAKIKSILTSTGKVRKGMKLPTGKADMRLQAIINANKEVQSDSDVIMVGSGAERVSMIATVNNAERAAAMVRHLGGRAHEITSTCITAEVPATALAAFVGDESVVKVETPRQAYIQNNKVREEIGVESIHSGDGLDTPFTGKGVLVGVIDQGFQYNHKAFFDADGNSRIVGHWDTMNQEPEGVLGAPTAVHDSLKISHGTHVTAIAAGSRHANHSYHGMAPDASILVSSSALSADEILNAAKWMTDVAKELNMPLVMNMSFGSNNYDHNGMDAYDRAMDSLLGSGRLLAGAMGNDALQNLHVYHEFDGEEHVAGILLGADKENDHILLWISEQQASDGINSNFDYQLFKFDFSKPGDPDVQFVDIDSINSVKPNTIHKVTGPHSKAYHCSVQLSVDYSKLLEATNVTKEDERYVRYVMMVDNLSEQAGMSFHAWNTYAADTTDIDPRYFVPSDNMYCTGDGGASVPQAIAVGSYVVRKRWTSGAGRDTGTVDSATEGQLSVFSSYGPSLGDFLRPTVCAPGQYLVSAYNSYVPESYRNGHITEDPYVIFAVDRTTGEVINTFGTTVTEDNKHDYDFYGAMIGTSMATPVVTGTLALWLQACPTLTPRQAEEIISNTSRADDYTEGAGQGAWNHKWGYGKIDAYAGLKAAIRLNEETGLGLPTMTDDKPLTISSSASVWRLLFNVPVTSATVRIYTTSGALLRTTTLGQYHAGDEHVVDLAGLAPGAYVLQVSTPGAVVTRKVVR